MITFSFSRFNQDATVLHHDLFDVYSSYYRKAAALVPPTSANPAPSTVTPSPIYDMDDIEFPPLPSILGKTPATETTPTQSTKSVTTTICNPELRLLLRGDNISNWSSLDKEKEYSMFHHCSYLLYTQRGLLETLPLTYSTVHVAPGASFRDNWGTSSDTKGDAPRTESVLNAYLNVHKPTKNLGYMYSYRNVDSAHSCPSKSTPTTGATPTPLPVVVADIPNAPKEMYLCIEALKPGVSYSAVIDFQCPVYLTDLAFQMSSFMFSVTVDAWLDNKWEEDGRSQRVCHSYELDSRSLFVSDIFPPILCRYARVSFVARMNAGNQRCAMSLGSYYGTPSYPRAIPIPSIKDGISLEVSKAFDRYSKSREELLDTLSMYGRCHASSLLRQQMEKEIHTLHTNCFNVQTHLARLRNLLSQCHAHSHMPTLSLQNRQQEAEATSSSLPLKKLIKLTGCLTDSILITIQSSLSSATPTSLKPLSGVISESDFRSLFLSHCAQGDSSLHARTCTVLITLCGGQAWWGSALGRLFKELYSSEQSNLFNKEKLVTITCTCIHCGYCI